MTRLSDSDVGLVTDFLSKGADVTSLEEYRSYVVEGLPRLVPGNAVGYNEVNTEARTLVMAFEPSAVRFEGIEAIFGAYMHQHPLVSYYGRTGDGRAWTISDFLSVDEFHRLDIYQLLYKRIDAEDQIAVTLPSPPPMVIGLALNRDSRSFTDRDRLVLNLARPYLALLHRQVEQDERFGPLLDALESAADASGQSTIVFDASGRVEFATAESRRLLERYFGAPLSWSGALPDDVNTWIARQRAWPPVIGSTPPAEALVVHGDDGRLTLTYLQGLKARDRDVLVLEERRAALPVATLAALGLTPREAEILAVLANGKTNPEIAAQLSLSEKTVRTHLERVYKKLGVTNRAAAVAAAFEANRNR